MNILMPADNQKIAILSIDGSDTKARVKFSWAKDETVTSVAVARNNEFKPLSLTEALSRKDCLNSLYYIKDEWQRRGGFIVVDYGFSYTLFPYIENKDLLLAQSENNSTGVVTAINVNVQRIAKKVGLLERFGMREKDEEEKVVIEIEKAQGLPDDLYDTCWYEIDGLKYPISISQFEDGCIYVPVDSKIRFNSRYENGNYLHVIQKER